jgi:SAM-dependent MidA family methyltransferase
VKQLSAELTAKLRREIDGQGAVSFHRFMQLSLYCPEFGYYEHSAQVIGRRGDFVTSVSAGDLFGRFLARQFANWCAEFSGPIPWIEAGAHDGRLASDILTSAASAAPELFERLRYIIIEPSEHRRAWQKETLKPFHDKIRWVPDLSELSDTRGVVFANELLDAFPVHRLRWNAATRLWTEWGVKHSNGRFEWQILPPGDLNWTAELMNAGIDVPPELARVLPDGFTLEFSPAAGEWWTKAASIIRQGWLVTFDYGLLAHEIIAPERSNGTLRAYRQHTVNTNLLETPGEQDLTAHINFSQLICAGEQAGLRTLGLFSQAEFLSPLATQLWNENNPPSETEARQFRTLAHPEHLGRAFRVLMQSRLH